MTPAMIGLIQRVSSAEVTVSGECIAAIGRGLMVLVGVQADDNHERMRRLGDRLVGYRVFPDAENRMNESLLDQGLELLLVPQFTLAADTRKGARPSFSHAAAPGMAEDYFAALLAYCRERVPGTASGHFAANMQVSLVNDGPVTFWLQS
jgi:D-tyrosyl-tRNA(Tyr) deacylase